MDLEVGLRNEGSDLLFPLDEDRECRGLDAANRCQLEATLPGVHSGEGSGAVDPDKPVALGAADGCRREWLHLGIVAKVGKALLDRLLGHRLEPESLHRLFAAGQLDDVVKNKLSLTAGVAGIDDFRDFWLLE